MEKDKVIFSVTKDGEGSAVMLDAKGQDDLFAVALGIHQAINQCPELTFMLSTIIMLEKDEDFQKKLSEATVDIPDFNAILKNTK